MNSLVRLVLPDVQDLLREGTPEDIASALAPFHSADIADLLEELDDGEASTLLLGLAECNPDTTIVTNCPVAGTGRPMEAFLADGDSTHRLSPVSDRFRHRHHVRDDIKTMPGKCLAGASESGDNLIEDEQNAVLVADLPQAL